MCFTETALEILPKTVVATGLVQIELLVLVARGTMVQPVSYFFISVCNLPSINRNIFFLLETLKSVHGILLMFAITICGIFCYRKEIKVLEILFEVSLSDVALLLYNSNPGHIAL